MQLTLSFSQNARREGQNDLRQLRPANETLEHSQGRRASPKPLTSSVIEEGDEDGGEGGASPAPPPKKGSTHRRVLSREEVGKQGAELLMNAISGHHAPQ